jgi:putative Mg2+ transporter-C (MgtC) family protein
VMGLCFGGGQSGLGVTVLIVGLVVLWGLKRIESRLPQDREGTLVLTIGPSELTDGEVRNLIIRAGFQIVTLGLTYDRLEQRRELNCELRWRARWNDTREAVLLDELARLPGVTKLKWNPAGAMAGPS